MEQLKYVIEDKTIAQLLGEQNFTNEESAFLELVKNAYDAGATQILISFSDDQILIEDNGFGMNEIDIKNHWMHVGKSSKGYCISDGENNKRILAGAKGVGRFALAKLGEYARLYSKKDGFSGVIWTTDWESSEIDRDDSLVNSGTKIVIRGLRNKWGKKRVNNLISFLSKTYNDDVMNITVIHPEVTTNITKYFPEPMLGRNCLSLIKMVYDSKVRTVYTTISSDEFSDEASCYCQELDLHTYYDETNMIDELVGNKEWDLLEEELYSYLTALGDFSGEFYFSLKPTKEDVGKFLYKHSSLSENQPGGVILYRNAFSITAYEGKKDWLGFGKRARKSPAAASHPTGTWRVRENQISGKVHIDKKENVVLQDLANRQGLDENIYFDLFVEIILTSIKTFERYRQSIIRKINVKNEVHEEVKVPIIKKIIDNPHIISLLTPTEAEQLVDQIALIEKEKTDAKRDKLESESRYRYDVRLLNVLATVGLKAASVAHEMRNDRTSIASYTDKIINALQRYGMWEELQSPEKTDKVHRNVPHLLERNRAIAAKITTFMNVMLSEIEKRNFEPRWQSVYDVLNKIKTNWERDYAWLTVSIDIAEDVCFEFSEDVFGVIFDNLILNSVQQNEKIGHLDVSIVVSQSNNLLKFIYKDSGKGLAKKYLKNPMKILEVHETTRINGHGLGMWIVNNTVEMSGGNIENITGESGFSIEFTVGSTV